MRTQENGTIWRTAAHTHQVYANSRAKLIFQYYIYNEADELVCTGETIQAFTSLEDNTLSLYKPAFYEKWEKHYL